MTRSLMPIAAGLALLAAAGLASAEAAGRISGRRAELRKSASPSLPRAAQGRQPVPPELAAARDRLAADSAALRGSLDRLRSLTLSYDGAADLDELAPRRGALLREVASGRQRLAEDHRGFRSLHREFEGRRQFSLFTRVLEAGKGAPIEERDEELLRLARLVRRTDRLEAYCAVSLSQDAEAFEAAQAARLRARRLPLVLGGGMALLLLAWLSKRGLPPPIPEPASAPERPAPPTPTPAVRTPPPGLQEGSEALPAKGDVVGGHFGFVRELGRGALGPAYEAVDLGTGRKVVVRRLRGEFHRATKDVDRLLAAARRAASLTHPNIAEVVSVFIEAERLHMVLEHVDGLPLSRFVRPGVGMALARARHVLWQLAEVLGYAHSDGVRHGDLKPSNIFILNDDLVKVLDFGLGPEVHKIMARLSWAEPVAGASYLAPEQELGTTLAESDIYSLGVVLYEMLTGRLPFEGPDFLGQKNAMRYPPPSRVRGLPVEFDAVMQRALQPEPRLRFHSAEELLEALDALPDSPGEGGRPLRGEAG